jgi:hypothetical protein
VPRRSEHDTVEEAVGGHHGPSEGLVARGHSSAGNYGDATASEGQRAEDECKRVYKEGLLVMGFEVGEDLAQASLLL